MKKESSTRSLNAAHSFESISSVCLPFSFDLSKMPNGENRKISRCSAEARSFNKVSISPPSSFYLISSQLPSSPLFFSTTSPLLLSLVLASNNNCCNSRSIFVPGINKVVILAVLIGEGWCYSSMIDTLSEARGNWAKSLSSSEASSFFNWISVLDIAGRNHSL